MDISKVLLERYKRRCSLNPQLHSRDERTDKAVGYKARNWSEKGEDSSVDSREGDTTVFLG